MFGVRKAYRELVKSVRGIQQENDQLKAENAKLRELVKHVISRYNDINREYWGNQEPLPCDLCNMDRQCSEVPRHDRCLFYEYLRELGVEV